MRFVNTKKLIFSLGISLVFCFSAFADHVVGSDILYKCLGNGKFEIIFKFYRDCNGCNVQGGGGGGTGQSCPHPVLNITGANGSCNGQALGTVNITRVSITDITQLCGSAKSACQNGSFPYGIEEHLYKGVVDLSTFIAQGCCKFKISTTIYVRSTTISTGAANQGFYTDATIDACNNICNNSPAYTSYPVAIICVGQDFVFNNGAIDTLDNGDSLSYALAPAYQGPSTTVSYSGSFTPSKPMSFLGFPNATLTSPAGFRLDSITGDLSFRPTKVNETGVIVIEVTEWRRINGTMVEVGRTRRDMQVIVVNCPNNNVPAIKPPYSAKACAGQQVCLDIVTTDADVNRDTVVISWNRGIPRATFTHNNNTVAFASGKVCWTPAEADVSNVPYTFTITARDNACPLNGVAVRAFSITVRESPKATRNFVKLTCGRVAMEATPAKNYAGGLVSEWRFKDSTGVTYYTSSKMKDTIQMRPGMNIATLSLRTTTPCVNAFADTIYIDPYVQIELPKDTFICEGGVLPIQSKTTLGIAPYKYLWNTADTVTSITLIPTKDTVIRVSVTDGQGCTSGDSMKVLYRMKPLIHLDTGSRICYNAFVELDAGNDTFPANYKYLWNTNDTSRKITVKDSNTYIAIVKDSIGCTDTAQYKLFVNTVPVSAGPDKGICYNDTLRITASGADIYRWYKLPSTTPFSSSGTFQEIMTTPETYRLNAVRIYGGVSCENEDTVAITINQLPVITFTPIKDRCEKASPFSLAEGLAYPTITNGTWSCAEDPDWVGGGNFFYPDSIVVDKTQAFKVITVNYAVADQYNCKANKSTTFRIIRLPDVVLKDTSLCGDKGKVDLKSITLPPTTNTPGTWKWSTATPGGSTGIENNGQNALFNLLAVPQNQTYQLCLDLTNVFGCLNTNCANISSRVVPVVDAGALAPKCGNDTIFSLNEAFPSPAGGIWQSASGGIVNTDWFNPALVLVDTHRLTYTYDIPGNNCPATDYLILRIKPVPSIGLSAIPGICSNAGIVNLMNYANPTGGIWKGTGINANGDYIANQPAGQYALRYDYTSSEGCKNFITGSINVDVAPTITVTPPDAACEGMPITVKASYKNSAAMGWTSTGLGSFSPLTDTFSQYQPAMSDKCIDITASTLPNGACPAASHTINVCFYPTPTATVVITDANGCEPHTVSFEAQTDLPNNAKYEWDFGDPASSDNTSANILPSHTYQTNGTYTINLKVTSERNCSQNATPVQAVIYPVPVADMDANNWVTTIVQNVITFTDRTTIDAPDNIASYLWSFGDPDSSFSDQKNPTFEYPTDSGKYWVSLKVVSNHGCESQTGRELIILPDIVVFIPNAFAPDKAGRIENERFWVTADGVSAFSITIFNRWGEAVYASTDISEGWDGNFKEFPVQQDVYFYVVKITGFNGVDYDYKGTVTLLR